MEKIRAFIAIELSDPIKVSLSSLIAKLRSKEHHSAKYVKWVDPKGIHLTLKFLGNIAPDQVPRIIESITPSTQSLSPLKLQLGKLGAFPNLQRPRVIWVAVTGEVKPLITLQQDVEQALAPLGFPPEGRSFSPHLTLGRLREQATPMERSSIGSIISATEFEGGPTLEVDQIFLMRSTLTPSGAIYNHLASIKLHSG
ncbi:MAG: RNA 2',3'-cyclic phosphodiesterase [Dehalococcoidia bacterium]|nr:RNA 2',3'-cyclic phosphodiesterase [Dehalococcoidia bacterium]